jgi:hypothetical protein
MPLLLSSRYHGSTVYDAPDTMGEKKPVVAARLAEKPEDNRSSYNHLVTGMETLEYLAFRYFGSSEAWWRIADANPRVFPTDIGSGQSVSVPRSPVVSKNRRTRSF